MGVHLPSAVLDGVYQRLRGDSRIGLKYKVTTIDVVCRRLSDFIRKWTPFDERVNPDMRGPSRCHAPRPDRHRLFAHGFGRTRDDREVLYVDTHHLRELADEVFHARVVHARPHMKDER